MARGFTISKLVENTFQNGTNLCQLLEEEPGKAIQQIKEIVLGSNDAYLRMLVRTLRFYLKPHPLIFNELKSRLSKEEPRLMVTLLEIGLDVTRGPR